jgi:hypothetical protein
MVVSGTFERMSNWQEAGESTPTWRKAQRRWWSPEPCSRPLLPTSVVQLQSTSEPWTSLPHRGSWDKGECRGASILYAEFLHVVLRPWMEPCGPSQSPRIKQCTQGYNPWLAFLEITQALRKAYKFRTHGDVPGETRGWDNLKSINSTPEC